MEGKTRLRVIVNIYRPIAMCGLYLDFFRKKEKVMTFLRHLEFWIFTRYVMLLVIDSSV